ncbi:MAG: hypothetical protein HY925_08645 [Elusimicrobia bacterium]|nr:hypothetical protein [Elusimicrobiota bacterium]
MRLRFLPGAWLAAFLLSPASFAAPVVEAPVPSIAGAQSVSGAAGEAALGPVFDGSRLLRSAFSPVLAPAVFAAAPAAEPVRLHAFDRTAPRSGGDAETVEGSIFSWKPAAESPNHGFPPIDALVRRLASRKDTRFDAGFTFGSAPRESARLFFYGERHTDRALIRENMRRLAEDLGRGQGGLIVDEGYMGPTLRGSDALAYLEGKGFDAAWLGPERSKWPDLEVRGWDAQEPYDASRTATLKYTIALYELNLLLHSELRGPRYYASLFSKAKDVFAAWREARRVAIVGRNPSLDMAVVRSLDFSAETGKTVHVIAGSEHLVERPLLAAMPLAGAIRVRGELANAIGGAAYHASMPASGGLAASEAELAFVAGASAELAKLADEIGAERGVKASAMTGADFLALIEAGRARFAAQAQAPTRRAYQGALSVQANLARVARALLVPGEPVKPQLPRLLSVWQVFTQEMQGAASEKKTVDAIEDDAKLFAEQVEQSV